MVREVMPARPGLPGPLNCDSTPRRFLNRRARALCGWCIVFCLGNALVPQSALPAEPSAPTARQLVERRVLVIAHRGANVRAPENTLPAFRAALACHADLVELDYYHSADGVPVVFHDKELDRTTDAGRVLGGNKMPITGVTREALGKLDAGAWFAAEFRGTPIPTLAEALGVIQAGSVTLIERKSGDPKTCIALLKSTGYLPRVVVQSFDWEFVGACHRQAPDLVLAALGSKELTAEKLEQIAGCGAAIVGWNEQDLQPGDVDRIHQRGWKLWVYTVNDVARAKELAALGIDGIITDDPAAMLAALQPWRER